MLPRKTCAHVTRAMRVWLICMWCEPVCELTVRARGGETRRCDTKILTGCRKSSHSDLGLGCSKPV